MPDNELVLAEQVRDQEIACLASGLEVAIKAREVLEDDQAWGQGFFEQVDVVSGATKYCALGALTHQNSIGAIQAAEVLVDLIKSKTDFVSVPDFNDDDTTTHEDVLIMFDLAIEKLRTRLMELEGEGQ